MENYLINIILFKHIKIKYFILVCFLLVKFNATAQNKQQLFGLRVSRAWASFLDSDLPNRYSPRGASYDVAIATHVVRSNRIGLIAEIGYVQKNVKDDFFDYSLNYLSLNLLTNFYFNKSKTTVFLGGSGLGMLFYKVINDYPKSGQYFNSLDFNLIIGVNQEVLTFDNLRVDVDTRFNLGLSNIRSSYWLNKTQNYGFSIGLLIKKELKKNK